MGYPLGKAQILSDLFSSWDPIYVHGSVWKMNQAYSKLGVDLRTDMKPYSEAAEKGLLQRRPWILVSTLQSGRSAFIRNLKRDFRCSYSGILWLVLGPSYSHAMAVDHAIPLSDHCDFGELVDFG